jgi:phosphatidylserine/phosphatidylglycerophosphate/cardiolipin synthase-like enzyme
LHQLIASAQDRILLVSFAAHTLSSLAHDLHAAVKRGVEVDVLFETTEDSAGSYKSTDDAPFGAIDGIGRLRWPTEKRAPGALLHAKALVIDRKVALVGSANLTRRALDANLELGLVVEDSRVARAIEDHVQRLTADRIIVVDNG